MNDVGSWALAISMVIVGATVHLVARPWSSRRLFLIDLGRDLTDEDRDRARRLILLNGAVTALGVGLAFIAPAGVAAVLVGLVLPFVPIGFLIVEMVRIHRTLDHAAAPSRFAVPLDEPPGMRRYLSAGIELAHGALLVGSTAVFVNIYTRLPARVPVHWDAQGEIDRIGGRGELWMWPGLMLFNWAIVWLVAYGVAKERWALPPGQAEAYQRLQLRRRTLITRLVQWLMLAINGAMALMWLGFAYGSLPGREAVRESTLVVSLVLTGVATIVPLVVSIRPLLRVQEQLRELAGSDVLGTREAGWIWGGLVYYAPDDPAVFVPKRLGIGQTLNFGRPGAWFFLGVITVVPLAITVVAIAASR